MDDFRLQGDGLHRPLVSNDARVIGTVRLNETFVDASAGASPNSQTLLIIQDEKARLRRVDEG